MRLMPLRPGAHFIPAEVEKIPIARGSPRKSVDAVKPQNVIDAENVKNLPHSINTLPPPIEITAPHQVPAIDGDAPVLSPLLRKRIVLKIWLGGRPVFPNKHEQLGVRKDVGDVITN